MTQDPKTAQDLLEGAYALASADDNLDYYKDFAAVYDDGYADAMGYAYPRHLCEVFLENALPNDGPIADIGCGTGLLAQALVADTRPIDGFDISPEMLAVAKTKSLYRSLHQVDLSQNISHLPVGYGAVLSTGTFTHGHLGPEALASLLQIARPDALFVVGINAQHYAAHGFQSMLEQLAETNIISGLRTQACDVYQSAEHEHSGDQAILVIFRRT